MLRPANYTDAERIVKIKAGPISLEGNLIVPGHAFGMVIFVHESGSNRFNPTNRFIAEHLPTVGVGALLFDLLDPQEAGIDKISRHIRFDVDLMAERAEAVADWVLQQPELQGLKVGYFGCGRGAAAALRAAAKHPEVCAVVSHGGRLDLAAAALGEVKAPTLLIVGKIRSLLRINKKAVHILSPNLEKKLEVFQQVSYFWDDPETLKTLSELTGSWFEHYLGPDTKGGISQHASELLSE